MSFFDDAGKILAQVAPTIASAVGGPAAGLGVRALINVLGLDEGTKTEDVMKAVANATPDQLLEIKKADQDFAAKMAELDIDLERIAAADRADARQREVATKDKMPAMIALAALTGFFGILAALIFVTIPAGSETALNVMLGSLGTIVVSLSQYYFGSSAGSVRKTEILSKTS